MGFAGAPRESRGRLKTQSRNPHHGRNLTFALTLLAVAISHQAGCSSRHPNDSAIGSVRELKALSARLDQSPSPAHISATVTYWDTDWRLAFVQDATGGLKLPTSAFADRPPRHGERVEIDAITGAGGEWPVLVKPSIRLTDQTSELRPPTIRLSDLTDQRYECELVRVEGILQSTDVGRAGRYRLKLATPDGELSGWIADDLGRDLHAFLDANVAITGVISKSSEGRAEARAARLWIQSTDDIQLLTPAPSPDSIPVSPVSELLAARAPLPPHRIHLRGAFNFDQARGGWFLSDATGQIKVNLAGGGSSVTTGERDLFGVLDREGSSIVVTAAESRKAHATAAGDVLRPLRNARQVHELTPEEAADGHPVHIRGVVTFYDRISNLLFVQDETGGIYLPPQKLAYTQFRVGDLLDVEGVSGPGEYAPVVLSPRVKVLGRAPLPKPADVPAEALFTGSQDCNWVRLEAVVSAIRYYDGRPFLNIVYGQHSALVLMPSGIVVPANVVDSTVRIEGVCGAQFNQRRQFVGVNLYSPRSQDLKLLKPAPRNLPVTPIVEASQYSQYSHGAAWSRARVEGIVTRTHPSGPTFIQDASGGILLQNHPGIVLQPGDRVHAFGMVLHGEFGPFLRDVDIVRLGSGPKLHPTPVAADEILEGAHNAELVQVEGTLTDKMAGIHGLAMVVQSRGVLFTAEMEGESQLQNLDVGSVLRLTGVCNLAEDPAGRSVSDQFELLLQGPDSVEVLRPAPWWSPRRTLALSGSLAVLILLSALWVFMLRRRVALQTLLIRSKLEREAQLEAQLAQASKLESIGRLAGGIAHDFNNLLTVINGYSDLLLVQTGAGMESFKARLQQIRRAGGRAAELTHQLLVFSRKQVIQPQAIDLNALLTENREMIQRLLGEDVTLTTRLEPALGPITADPGQMHQVLMNLAANARDAMPNGGELLLETANIDLDEAFVETHPEVVPGPFVMFTATDTGVGMDENTRRHLFEPFFTTKETDRGTGLGLATVYGIVSQSHGCIEVYSAPQEGSVFRIYLPRSPASVAVKEPRNVESRSLKGSGTILVAEDQEGVRNMVVETLHSYGYRLLEAHDGQSALELGEGPEVDLDMLLTDVTMPGMNGRELAERLQALHPRIKVLYMSGHSHDILTREGVLDPGIEFLQKPFAPRALVAKVRELLSAPED